jgi:CHAT domain-containing protein/Tfp pilus assembly protein PilF
MGQPRSFWADLWPLGKKLLLGAALVGSLARGEAPNGLEPGENAWWRLMQANGDSVMVAEFDRAEEYDDRFAGGGPRLAVCLAEALERNGRSTELETLLARLRPVPILEHLVAGRLAVLRNEPAAAESLLTLALTEISTGETTGISTPGALRDIELIVREQLGVMLIDRAQPEQAIAMLTEAMTLARESEQSLAAAHCQLHLGRALIRTRDMTEAARYLEDASRNAESWRVPQWQGDAEIALSVIARLQMDLDEALRHRRTALQAYRQAGSLSGQARSLHYIATIHILRGELTTAMRLLHEALELAERAAAPGERSGCLGDLAGLNYLLGEYDLAVSQYRQAAELSDNPRRAGFWLSNIGSLLIDQQRHEEALRSLEEARELLNRVGDRRAEADVLNAIGRCHCEMGRYEEGIAHLDAAVAASREWSVPMSEASALRNQGFCQLAEGDLEAAQATFDAAAELAQQVGTFDIIEAALLGQAVVARRQGAPAEALPFLERAIASAEEVRRSSGGSPRVQSGTFGQAADIYQEMIDLLFELHGRRPEDGQDRRAFDIAQRAKARSFLDLLAEADVDLRCRADPRYQQREHDIQNQVAELEQQRAAAAAADVPPLEERISRLQAELDILEAELREADPRYTELRYPRPETLAEVQREVLREGELLLEYALGDSASYVFALTRTSFLMAPLPRQAEIEAATGRLLPLLADYNLLGTDPAYFLAAAAPLSRTVLKPVATEIARAGRIIVCPSGILHYLPFEVLLLGDIPAGGGNRFDQLPYLALQADLIYVPSVSTLARLRTAESGPEPDGPPPARSTLDLLVVGNPTLPAAEQASVFVKLVSGGELAPLPFADHEIRGLMDLVPDARRRILEGDQATFDAVAAAGRQGAYRYVHFATHGLFNEKRPQYSGLVLTPAAGGEDDGFMTTAEVFQLELPCDQVVLSACATALGEKVTGEGLVGLTRGFMYAGARSVVASLWDVSGRATASFMTDFYREMKGGDQGRAHALAGAKRRMIRGESGPGTEGADPAHPYFWAAFVLIGDDR